MVTFLSLCILLVFAFFAITTCYFFNSLAKQDKQIQYLYESNRALRISIEQRYDYLFIQVENLEGRLHDLEQSIKPVKPLIRTSHNNLDFDITQASYQGDPYS